MDAKHPEQERLDWDAISAAKSRAAAAADEWGSRGKNRPGRKRDPRMAKRRRQMARASRRANR